MKFYETIDQIINDCPKFFVKQEICIFGMEVEPEIYAGRFFITSEKMQIGIYDNPRIVIRYTVCEVMDDGDGKPYIGKSKDFTIFRSKGSAIKAITKFITTMGKTDIMSKENKNEKNKERQARISENQESMEV